METAGGVGGDSGETFPCFLSFSVPIIRFLTRKYLSILMPGETPRLRMWGRFEHGLDDKGRVIIPQKFRESLGTEFVVTAGPGNHVRVYPLAVWEELENALYSADPRDELNRELSYLQRMLGNCDFVSLDAQFRLSVPRHLREWADIPENTHAVIVGSGNRLEIWSVSKWKETLVAFDAANADTAMFGRREPAPVTLEIA